METPLSAEEYHRVGMAFTVAGDFTSALKAFGKGISVYPNNTALQYSYRLAFQCLPGTRTAAEVGRRAPRIYNGVDAPIKPAAMLYYYNAVNCV